MIATQVTCPREVLLNCAYFFCHCKCKREFHCQNFSSACCMITKRNFLLFQRSLKRRGGKSDTYRGPLPLNISSNIPQPPLEANFAVHHFGLFRNSVQDCYLAAFGWSSFAARGVTPSPVLVYGLNNSLAGCLLSFPSKVKSCVGLRRGASQAVVQNFKGVFRSAHEIYCLFKVSSKDFKGKIITALRFNSC